MEVINMEKPDEYLAALEAMKRELENVVEFGKLKAKIRKKYYDACINEGFTPEQALILTNNYDLTTF